MNKGMNKKEERIGETKIARNGLAVTITKYRTNQDIDVEFEDGLKVTNKTYKEFQLGSIRHPDINFQKQKQKKNLLKKRIGEKKRNATNDEMMTIVEYEDSNNITIEYEDGNIRKNIRYEYFKKGVIGYPKEYKTLKIGKLAYHVKDKWAFYVKCEKCGLSDIMTYEQMQKHSC